MSDLDLSFADYSQPVKKMLEIRLAVKEKKRKEKEKKERKGNK